MRAQDRRRPARSRVRSTRPRSFALRLSRLGLLVGLAAPVGALVFRAATVPAPIADAREHVFFYAYMAVFTALVAAAAGFGVGRLLDALKESRDAFRALSEIDELTGLPNRRSFEAARKRLSAEAAANGVPLGCLYLNLDDFKRFNEAVGRDAGDEVLIALGRILRRVGRQDDVAARLGGDEFGLLMSGASREAALGVSERIRKELRDAGMQIPNLTITPAVSIGMAFANESDGLERLVRDADADLVEAKRALRRSREERHAAGIAVEGDSTGEA